MGPALWAYLSLSLPLLFQEMNSPTVPHIPTQEFCPSSRGQATLWDEPPDIRKLHTAFPSLGGSHQAFGHSCDK